MSHSTRVQLYQGLLLHLKNSAQRLCERQLRKLLNKFFLQIRSFHEKSDFYPDYKTFWVVENSKLIIDRLECKPYLYF